MADALDQAYWNRWLDTVNRSQGRIAPTGRMTPANDTGVADPYGPGSASEWSRWLDTLRRNMGSSMSFKPDLPPSNSNEVMSNAVGAPPKATPPWQDLLTRSRYPFPANTNIPGGSAAPAAELSIEAPSVLGTTINTASRFLPAWAQAAIAAGQVMWPTPTAPPSMDEAPPWSWPPQNQSPRGPQ